MKKKNLFLIFYLMLSINSQVYKENTELYCKKIDKSKWQISDEERIKQRENLYPLMKGSLGAIVAFLNHGEIMALMTGVIIHIILVALIFIGALVSFFIFMFFFCYYKKSPKKSKKRARLFFCVSLFIGIMYIINFLVFTIIFSGVKDGTDEMNCALSNSTGEVLDGANNDYYEFLGFNILISMLEDLEIEAENLKSVTDNFDKIFNLNLAEQGKSPITSLNEYFNLYKDQKLKDGEGNEESPILIVGLEKTKEEVNIQFEIWKNIGDKISSASEVGKSLSTNDSITSFKEILSITITETKTYKDELLGPLNNLSNTVGEITQFFSLVFTLGAVLGGLSIVLFLFTIVILFFQCRKLRCYKCNFCLKLSLFLLGVVSLVFSGISIYVMIITSSMGTVCSDIPDILASEEPASLIASLGIGMNESLDKLANNCLKNSTTGEYTELITGADFASTEILLEGITTFKNFQANLTLAPEDSEIITNTTKVWKNYETGFFVNFENVKTTLDVLNTQLECENQEMVFNKQNCTIGTKGICFVIPEVTIPYNPPECVDDTTETNNIFTRLRDYNLGNQEVTSKMITNLSGEETSTPNYKYKDFKNSLNLAMIEQKIIEPKVFRTLNNAAKLKYGFSPAINCHILRKELLNVEAGICFVSINSSFLSYVFVLLMNIFLICYNWAVFCTIRNIVEDRPFNKLNDSVELGDDASESEA